MSKSDDLIRREDAYHAGCKTLCYPGPFCPDVYCKEMKEVFDSIPAVDVPKWIPVTVKLPEKDGEYFITWMDASQCRFVNVVRYSEEYGFGGIWNECIIAWMPMPKPYKGGIG